MRQPGEWMHLPTDHYILEMLATTELILSPSVIAKNVDRNRETIARRLRVLTDYGLVERVERGYYRITDDGRAYLDGNVDADTLEADPPN